MPSMVNVLDCATEDSWFCDVDVGEMFLNFPLDLRIRPYCGVDLSWQLKGKRGYKWERWNRMAMGMSPSPWVCTRLLGWMMEIVMGDHKDENNPFRWDDVIVNCPGMDNYNPAMPRLYKWNAKGQVIAMDVQWFMDDLRGIGPNEDLIQKGIHKLESTMSYLGIQDATRKRRKHGQHVGEWVGAISVAVKGVGLFQTVSEKKWDKAKTMIDELLKPFEDATDRPMMDHKDLERKTGFLVHLSMVFEEIAPFLKGLYLTMNSWRKGRKEDGWKIKDKNFWKWIHLSRRSRQGVGLDNEDKDAPNDVRAVPSLYQHLKAIQEMVSSDLPTLKLVRGSAITEVGYVFGDASGEGYGLSKAVSKPPVGYRYGVWGPEEEDKSSNFKEFNNLVVGLEDMGVKGELEGKEIFVFTDNAVTEAIAAKGSSSSPLLFDLVVRLYKLNMRAKCKIQFIHVAGTRMIDQGTDGLSRGNMLEGVMKGKRMLDFIPIHKSALDRSPDLEHKFRQCMEGKFHQKMEVLTPNDWFWRGHDISGMRANCDGFKMPSYESGSMLWSPPPAVARFAIEQLRQARHKRQQSCHVMIVPRLMTLEWRRHTLKGADIVFNLPVGSDVWSREMHEPLTIAIFFPYLSRKPWELRKSPLLVDLERKLPKVFKDCESTGWHLLSELFDLAQELHKMSIRDLREVLQGRGNSPFSSQSPLL
jgi:hypothetical protein